MFSLDSDQHITRNQFLRLSLWVGLSLTLQGLSACNTSATSAPAAPSNPNTTPAQSPAILPTIVPTAPARLQQAGPKPVSETEVRFFNYLAEFDSTFDNNQMWTVVFFAYMAYLRDNGGNFDFNKFNQQQIQFRKQTYTINDMLNKGFLKPIHPGTIVAGSTLMDWPDTSEPSCDEVYEALFWKMRSQFSSLGKLVIDDNTNPTHDVFNITRVVGNKRWWRQFKIQQGLDFLDQKCGDKYKVNWNYQTSLDGSTQISVERTAYDLTNKYGGLQPEKRLPALITSGIMVLASSQPGFAPILVLVVP